MRNLMCFLILSLGLNTAAQDINSTIVLYKNKSAIVFFSLKELPKNKRAVNMRGFAMSNRYLIMQNKTYNVGYLDEFRDPAGLSRNFSNDEISKIPLDTSDFDFFLQPYFRDSIGIYPPDIDVNYGGETFTHTDNDTSLLIIAFRIKGDFFSTEVKHYIGLKRVFCFDNEYKDFTLVPTKVTQVKKLTKKQIKKMGLKRYRIKSYCFVNCD